MTPKFGTSGLRGLVTELTPALIADYVRAFLSACPVGASVFIGHDLRPSSGPIARMVLDAVTAHGIDVTWCDAVPVPALALAASRAQAGAIMVTGSHIPADRNGLKFYTTRGEITKADEAQIMASLGQVPATDASHGVMQRMDVGLAYAQRMLGAYADALRGKRIGLYEHSAVGRDLMADIITDLGAEVIRLGRSDVFIPIDTEAVSPVLRKQLQDWARAHDCDAIISTDADGDRPLLTDETGVVIPGDILGQITAASLKAAHVVTPVSSNTGVEALECFDRVTRTKIGSPFVIAAMSDAGKDTVGYEANGGFLLGYAAQGPAAKIAPLMTRDAVLPILAVLYAARDVGVAELVAQQPARFTATDRLEGVDPAQAKRFVETIASDAQARSAFLSALSDKPVSVDRTDGIRIALASGRIVHMRPSGNAPEFRLYIEAESKAAAQDVLARGLDALRGALSDGCSHQIKS
ncbi:phosphomannomutase [Yoonia sp. F2084L]|uniref:phosphomannomutase n=1 Tax=Yoonia sp. F2084L TaxID=2926419 RepID=UPI001FF27BCA|nr:phosphomannomutase [Yoonia sp. F2084L]MCK0097077.1 phosphomannomutase [Yoonia sp. F2084L]